MKKTFPIQNSNKLNSVTVIERDETYYLEIETKSDTNFLKRQIDSFCMAAQSDGDFECNFKIIEEANTIILVGNISNALMILLSRALLPGECIKKIKDDTDANLILEKSKNYVPKDKMLLTIAIENVEKVCDQIPNIDDQANLLDKLIQRLENKKLELVNCGQQQQKQEPTQVTKLTMF